MSLSISVDPDLVESGLERAIEPKNTPDRFFLFTGLYYACHQRGV